MFGECNRCGTCCRAIPLTINLTIAKPKEICDGDVLVNFWKPITRDEAVLVNSLLTGVIPIGVYFYRCEFYHEKEGCLLHGQSEKPKACIDFPWYGCASNSFNLTMDAQCGYRQSWFYWEQFLERMTLDSWNICRKGDTDGDD